MGTLRSILQNGLLLLGGLVGALLVAEGVAGLLWKAPWHERLLTEQTAAQRHPVRRNSLGLRGGELETPRPQHLRRVLMVGDSFTFGLGVEDDAAPFPALLDRRLRARSVQVVNGGIPGSLTGDWGALWRRAGAVIDPEVVVAVFFLRDGTKLETIPHFFGEIREGVTKRNESSRLYRYSRLYRWIRDLQAREWIAETYTDALTEAYLGPPQRTVEWRRAQRNLVELRDMVETHGAVFALAVFPVLVELDDAYPFQAVTDLVMAFARENGIPVHDLLEAFRGHDAPDLWVSAVDQHPNARGHQIAADSLEPFVEELLSLRRP
ncbi:MAG: GDSL-type esterase/lipase family protein [Myxococcota bacterium]|nr:GDSL-type esterase/lipase family protein [Myxococcota bacterium]